MAELTSGAVVRVVNPSQVVEISAPGLVKGVWLKEGPPGPQGQPGATGPANTLTIGTVTTGAPGSLAAAAVSGVAPNQTLSLTIPKGDKGDKGDPGPAGAGDVTGPASSVDSRVAVFNGATGKLITDGGATIAGIRDRSTHTGTQSADTVIDGTTNKAYTATEKTKLAGIATAATANATDAQLRDRSTHTGTQSLDTTTDSATRLAMTAAERTKLTGVATGATANSSDATLLNRTNHTGTQAASTITGLATVATSGAYGDLSGKPTLGTAAAANTGTGAGQIPVLSGTPGAASATTYLTGAGTWATPAGGGGSGVLAVQNYQPASVTWTVNISAWADLDATNLAVTFTAPASGKVLVVAESWHTCTTAGALYLRLNNTSGAAVSTQMTVAETPAVAAEGRFRVGFYITGLTASTSYTYRLAAGGSGTAGSNLQAGTTLGPARIEVWST